MKPMFVITDAESCGTRLASFDPPRITFYPSKSGSLLTSSLLSLLTVIVIVTVAVISTIVDFISVAGPLFVIKTAFHLCSEPLSSVQHSISYPSSY
jgi:hypothetical protein